MLFPKIVSYNDKAIPERAASQKMSSRQDLTVLPKTMYPDWLSMSGEGYIAEMYKKYKESHSPMGCRAFLSPWYERGGMEPVDENDKNRSLSDVSTSEPFPFIFR